MLAVSKKIRPPQCWVSPGDRFFPTLRGRIFFETFSHPFPTLHEGLPFVGLQTRALPAGPWMQISGPRRDFGPTPKSEILETTLKNCPRENAPRIFENSASVLPLWGAPACRRPTKIRAGGAAGAFEKNSPAPLRKIINFGRPALQHLHT